MIAEAARRHSLSGVRLHRVHELEKSEDAVTRHSRTKPSNDTRGDAMKKKLISSIILLALGALGSSREVHACSYQNVTCNTFLGTSCDGGCDGDVCQGTQMNEYACTDGSVQFTAE